MKSHHPQDRAERLRIKKIKFETKDKEVSSSKARRRLKEQIKQQETEDELRRVRSQGSLDPIVP